MKINRVWAMPNSKTFLIKPIAELIKRQMDWGYGDIWIDPFSGNNSPAQITNDLNPHIDSDYHMDALDFLKSFPTEYVNGILFDPPYSARQIKEMYQSVGLTTNRGKRTRCDFWSMLKDEIARIVKPNGKVICFGWNSMGMGKTRGFAMQELLIVPHGGNHNDTIVTVEVKEG